MFPSFGIAGRLLMVQKGFSKLQQANMYSIAFHSYQIETTSNTFIDGMQ